MSRRAMLIAPATGGGASFFKTVTIDHTIGSPTTDLTDFPMIFTYTNANLKTVANGGQVGNVNDISFATTSGGAVDLVWDNPQLDATTGKFTAIVKVPTRSHTSDTVIFLRWDGNTRGSTQAGTFGAAYDSHFIGVFHVSDDGSSISVTDRTANGNNLAISVSPTAGVGDYRGVGTFNGTSQYLTSSVFPALRGPWTIMARVNADATGLGNFRSVACQGDSGTRSWFLGGADGSASNVFYAQFTQSGAFKSAVGATTRPTGSYVTLHAWWDQTTERIYLNGVSDGSSSIGGTADNGTTSGTTVIGRTGNSSTDYWKGQIGDVRMSDIARSADWLKAEHLNYNSPATFYSVT